MGIWFTKTNSELTDQRRGDLVGCTYGERGELLLRQHLRPVQVSTYSCIYRRGRQTVNTEHVFMVTLYCEVDEVDASTQTW